jgi:hypothetical protein
MPKTFNDLTPEQQAAFWADVKRWGLEESDVPAESDTGQLGSNACISSVAADTNVPTKPFTLTSVEHMKEMVGIPDELFASGKMRDRMVSYPEDLPADRMQLAAQAPNFCALKDSLTEDEHDVIRQAWLAYLVGDSGKVSPEMVSMINAVHFPAVVAVAAVQNITVAANTVYTFGTPGAAMQVIPIGVLTIEAGGSIAFASPCTLQCQSTTAAAASSMATVASAESVLTDPAPTNNINIYSPAPPPPATPPPQQAKGQASNATPGRTVTSTGKNPTTTCDSSNPSVAASNGDTGYGGTGGTNGQNGISPPPVISYLGVVTGTYNFMAGGGNAQNGGKGGDAGLGGQGGNGVSGAGGKCANQPPGKGGLGGTGGPGGVPGDGANGSASYFYYTSIQQPFTYNITPVGGYGGQPGLGGAGGKTTSGGSDPAGTQGPSYNAANYNLGAGPNGATGNNGNAGKNANAGSITFQLKPA